ncbi:MAG: hypothetical protein KF730_15625 [Sphingomonas sp.]|uniref:hypothetical protein n=1 Tax=Sphingomonas sp. TaxID=28214 RepID=UPI0025F9F2CB|nr:hypothetical protein [Sphingomonas sp.]MBX3565995.1 hypothetical protein [Sphingomonas sp.]
MIRTFAIGLAASLSLAAPAFAQTFANIGFAADKLTHRISDDDVQVTLTAKPQADDAGLVTVSAAIRMPGYAPFTLSEEDFANIVFDRQVAIGKLASGDPAPSVLFQTYTGGAHCCAQLWAAVPFGGQLQLVKFPLLDGEGIRAFPEDQDGDDIVDFVFKDDRFNYAFSSYAGSYAPPQIFNVTGGKIVDVSGRDGFTGLFEETAEETRKICADKENDDRNGACATYVAASARLGRFDAAIKEAVAMAAPPQEFFLPRSCKVAPVDGECPDGQEIVFPDFESALRWFLRDTGYIR